MLKASSLLYAIFICLVVSLLCGSLILIFNYQYRLKQQFFLENELVNYSNSSFLKFIDLLNTTTNTSKGSIISDDNRLTTNYTLSKWGFYDLVKAKTYFKNDTLYKTGLIGSKTTEKDLALYLTEYNAPLKIGGKTRVVGDVKISSYGVEQAYLSHQNFTGGKLIEGKIGHSSDRLPRLEWKADARFTMSERELYYEEIVNKPLYNSFYEPTITVIVDGITHLSEVTLSGNFIIQSKDSLVIKETAKLKDVLIKAPKVTFSSGFNGSVQVFAKARVHLEKRVHLQYPSSIYLNNDNEDKSIEIFIDEHSKIAGGVVLTGNTYEGSLKRLITIEKDAEVVGDVYCYGKTQLKGKVTGTVYTDRFYLKTDGGTYENYLVNGSINKKELPSAFVGLPLFANNTRVYELIKEL
ncbi:hypothetical protein [Lacinutrix sp. Hel_I_90]|uniref:hypothetical protein n=1 Tax=Lacinutrix sp. Hel_I_90 TaxID=1249999 RepID=UPI0005C8DECE|nr:hypothetical protein [Lacinutrix sp. Hel_I_90]